MGLSGRKWDADGLGGGGSGVRPRPRPGTASGSGAGISLYIRLIGAPRYRLPDAGHIERSGREIDYTFVLVTPSYRSPVPVLGNDGPPTPKSNTAPGPRPLSRPAGSARTTSAARATMPLPSAKD